MSLGATLRQARGDRKLSSEQVSSATRIPLRIILAMEQDEWAKVPPGIFARGYLRAYAREIGLDGEALVAQYNAEQAPPPPEVHEEETPEAAQPGTSRAVVRLIIPALSESASRWVTGTAMVALLLLVYVAGRWSTGAAPPAPEPAGLTPTSAAAPASSLGGHVEPPVGTSAQAQETGTAYRGAPTAAGVRRPAGDVALPVPPRDAPLDVDVSVTRPCWVSASADGARSIYRIVQPGERVPVRGRVLTLRVGDAGALQLTLEGQTTRPLGASGEVLTIKITRENYRSLLPVRVGG